MVDFYNNEKTTIDSSCKTQEQFASWTNSKTGHTFQRMPK